MTDQMELFQEVPSQFVDYYEETGRCFQCKQPINHYIHLDRHFRRWHKPQVAKHRPLPRKTKQCQRFFVLQFTDQGLMYKRVDVMAFLVARQFGRATAYTKPV